ncbi:hypothetical protein H0H81_005127 [Sphagnurus paluster]|uniref:Uncharacterized protein n=1 Tax=Sphagnurus paluster TaxID=117069 RepID=A0A9P7GQ92_9AGAR|nr:hypothetical protein H0H81_005127 [Sphagnurus paluster]
MANRVESLPLEPLMLRRQGSTLAGLALFLFPLVLAQLTTDEFAPLLSGLAEQHVDLEARVPLMTDDPTVAPLVDLQVFAPPVVPKRGQSCAIELLKHSFGVGSYNTPAIVPYAPPTASACGEPGKWAAISLNVSVYS